MTSPPTRTALLTGADGQLGRELLATVPKGWRAIGCSHATLDVTNESEVRYVLQQEQPGLVINAAAYTGVDAAESEPELASAVNATGAANVARASRERGARLVHLSSDFVFDGTRGRPYLPGDPTHPVGVYGRTKLEGEEQVLTVTEGAALVLRTAWVYAAMGKNFVGTMLRLMREKDSVNVVSDQVGTPTWARGLAGAIWAAAERPGVRGVHHWTDAGVASWYDFAVAIQEEATAAGLLDRAVPVRPIRTADFPTPAARPPYSVLDKTATWEALGLTAPHWRAQLRLMLQDMPRG